MDGETGMDNDIIANPGPAVYHVQPHFLAQAVLIDHGHAADTGLVIGKTSPDVLEEAVVDRVDQLQVALVVHNNASTDLLDTNQYQERFGVPNPNADLLRELMDAGVQVLFCGQSSMARKVPIEDTVQGVQLSLSATTALIQLQESGYHLIKF